MNSLSMILVSGAVAALITYFFTSLMQGYKIKKAVEECFKNHDSVFHRRRMEDLISEHEKGCKAPDRIEKFTKALIYIVSQLGGNPAEMGLME